jgi:hypothetical protein
MPSTLPALKRAPIYSTNHLAPPCEFIIHQSAGALTPLSQPRHISLPTIISSQRARFPSFRHHFFATHRMADQSTSARFHALFQSALQAYEKKTGIKLAEHPLALHLQTCQSVGDINTHLQSQAQAVGNSQASDRIIKSIKKTLSILVPLSEATSLSYEVGLVSRASDDDRFHISDRCFR